MFANGCGLDVTLGFGLPGPLAGEATLRGETWRASRSKYSAVRTGLASRPRRPRVRRQRNQHALVVAHDIDRQVVGRDIELGHLLAMGLLDAALEQGQHVNGASTAVAKPSSATRVAQLRDFRQQHRFNPSEQALDAPAGAVQVGNLLGLHLGRQVAPQQSWVGPSRVGSTSTSWMRRHAPRATSFSTLMDCSVSTPVPQRPASCQRPLFDQAG